MERNHADSALTASCETRMARSAMVRHPAERASPTDDSLVLAYAGGDVTAFDALYARYEGRVFGFCLQYLGDEDAAADAFQETFVRMVDGAARYEPRGRFPSWIFTIARRACVDILRAGKKHLHIGDAGDIPAISEPTASEIEHRDTLEHYLSRLAPEQREVLLLHRYHGFAYEEIAKMTGSTVAAVKQKAYRALSTLRALVT